MKVLKCENKNRCTSLTWLGGKMETKTSLQLTLAGQKNILTNYLQKSIPTVFNNISIVNVNKRTHTKFPPLVPTKSQKTYNQQKDQNRLWGGGFQYWRCSPCMCQANWMLFSMFGAEIPVFHEPDQVCLCSFLQTQDGVALEVQVIFAQFKGYLTD